MSLRPSVRVGVAQKTFGIHYTFKLLIPGFGVGFEFGFGFRLGPGCKFRDSERVVILVADLGT